VLGALAAGILLGVYLWRALSPAAIPAWKGTFLGGPSRALGPRISPDGKTLAFQTMVDGVSQVAVMKPESGDWTVLTREREQGAIQEIAWSPDGTRLYFSRVLGHPRGIYSVPVLGGEERLVLEGAAYPEMLPDGSLVVVKIDAKRQFQIYHYWPETGKLEPLPAEIGLTDVSLPLRTPAGTHSPARPTRWSRPTRPCARTLRVRRRPSRRLRAPRPHAVRDP